MLRNRLVCGINHEAIQRKLLAEKDLTYHGAYLLAQSIQTTECDSRLIKGCGASAAVGLQDKALNFTKLSNAA